MVAAALRVASRVSTSIEARCSSGYLVPRRLQASAERDRPDCDTDGYGKRIGGTSLLSGRGPSCSTSGIGRDGNQAVMQAAQLCSGGARE